LLSDRSAIYFFSIELLAFLINTGPKHLSGFRLTRATGQISALLLPRALSEYLAT
jgi:hypothetical protein